jgi:5-methylcytosine-specific restriction enzyme A
VTACFQSHRGATGPVPPKSPPWTRDETILALDLYYRMGRRVPNPGDLPVIQVSRYLNQLPIHDLSVRASNFRNPSGVVLKIANLRAFDKSTSSVGMSGGSRLDREIYEEFEDRPDRVAKAAQEVLRRYGLVGRPAITDEPHRAAEPLSPYRTRFDRYALHLSLEQDMNVNAARRYQARSLTCEACGFDFGHMYGARGEGYIQYHHRTPLTDLDTGRRPSPDDLHLICANCHAMLHAGDRPITVEELRTIVRERQRSTIRDLASRLNDPEP